MDINADEVLQLGDTCFDELQTLLSKYGLTLQTVKNDTSIPGSFWGDEEAGLIHDQLYARPDTPIHSILHESCHYICMDKARRSKLHTNAGGTTNEENAVCYLQILLADHLSFIDRTKMTKDMDSWGYSFRLGSTKAWFESDAEDAQEWLISHCLINENNGVTFNLRH
jgi:hypothetical protein